MRGIVDRLLYTIRRTAAKYLRYDIPFINCKPALSENGWYINPDIDDYIARAVCCPGCALDGMPPEADSRDKRGRSARKRGGFPTSEWEFARGCRE